EHRVEARETPIGYLPYPQDINTTNLDISDEVLETLTSIDRDQWRAELKSVGEYLDTYGDRLPDALRQQQQKIAAELG
ncbi:MAG: phosphoenolpyruvate carboxykinase domain-containing protein, partial [Gammaproteobacteria bacterium]|nr:phosphoenolpyruvate carboxykinase domain-containing protein [Gammaproteobacteria bacterium]